MQNGKRTKAGYHRGDGILLFHVLSLKSVFSPPFHGCLQRSLLDRPQKPYSNRECQCFSGRNRQPYAGQAEFHRQNDQKQK